MKKLLTVSSVIMTVFGSLFILSGVWGIYFTYQNIAREKITTPEDAVPGKKPVRGPMTLQAQADIIRKHTLDQTNGQTYAEMPRQIEKVDTNNKPVMVPNTSRDIWITATTLTTALNLGILAYAVSTLTIALGVLSIVTGISFYYLAKNK